MIKKKTLHVHMVKELLGPFILGLLIFTFILLMNKTIKLIELVINRGVGLDDVAKLIMFLLPSFLVLTIPMSILLAILISLGRLSSDSEIIALRASGISLYQMLPPFIFFCIIGFMLTNIVTLFLLPRGNSAFRDHLFNLSKRHSEANLEERIFNDDFEGLIIYINEIPAPGNPMKGILISDKRESRIPSIIIGEEAVVISDPNSKQVTLRVFNGSIHRSSRDSFSYQEATFTTYDMNLQLSRDEDEQDNDVSYREMGISELLSLSRERAKANRSAVRIGTEIHKRFSFPFACLVLGIIGIPVGAYSRKGSRAYGFILCIVVLFLYYLFLNLGESLAKRGILYPVLGIWMPNVILGIMGIYFMRVVGREKPIPLMNWIDENLTLISNIIKKRFG